MKHYLCKFIPPRADFLATMTNEEQHLMSLHKVLMDDLMAKGLVVAHGPVIDEFGGWGLSLYQVDEEQDIQVLTSQDPMVLHGGAHYEMFPMLHLTLRH